MQNRIGIHQLSVYAVSHNQGGFLDIHPGSGIVGYLHPSGDGIVVYYEGNLYGACNLHKPCERIINAAGRAFTRYPTVAMGFVHSSRRGCLIEIGTVDDKWNVEITNQEAAEEWFSQYAPI